MPYIIAVNHDRWDDPYTVATLEEAREAAASEVERAYDALDWPTDPAEQNERLRIASYWAHECRLIPCAGSALGPLPDGYVVSVSLVSYAELAKLTGDSPEYEDMCARLLLIYNGE